MIPVSAWLPFDPSGQPVFAMRGDWKEPTAEAPVAIWPGLFEKAYAEFKQRRLEEQHDQFAAEWGTIAWGDRKLVQDRDPTNQDEAFLKAMGLKVTPVRSRPNADAAFALPATAKTAIRNAFQQGSVVQASTSEHQYTIQAADDGGVVVWDPRMSRKGAGWDVPVPAQAGSGPAGELLRPTRFTWSHFSTAFVKVTVARP